MYLTGNKLINKHKKLFKNFKKQVRKILNDQCLKKFTKTTIVKNVYTEKYMEN